MPHLARRYYCFPGRVWRAGVALLGACSLVTVVAFVPSAGAAPVASGPARAAGGPRVITVTGTGVPAVDVRHLNDAFLTAGRTRRTVQLVGTFNVGDRCVFCVRINNPVNIVGTGDPTVARPNPAQTTIIKGGLRGGAFGPFAYRVPDSAGPGPVAISRLWFDGATGLGIVTVATNPGTELRISYDRSTGLQTLPGPWNVDGFIGAWDARASTLNGDIQIDHNYIDTRPKPFWFGDDNPIGFARQNFSHASVTDNTLISRGETEFEGGTNPDAVIVVARNQITMNASPSPDGLLYAAPGHPAAIKVHGNLAQRIIVAGNYVRTYGSSKGVCLEVTVPQTPAGEKARTLIQGNTCAMTGTGIGLAAGWTGVPGFFPNGSLQNARVVGNTFTGTALWGIAFLNYTAPPGFPPVAGLSNEGHGNTFVDNNMSGLHAIVALQFGPQTHDNLFIGNPHGRVINRGTHNTIIP